MKVSINSSSLVQSIPLTECGDDVSNIDVIALGNGATSVYYGREDMLLRLVYLTTMTSADCENRLRRHKKRFSVICAEQNEFGGRVWNGDSGGPLLRRSNGALIGLVSFDDDYSDGCSSITNTTQVFTRIQAYFGWISKTTGLKVPVCGN